MREVAEASSREVTGGPDVNKRGGSRQVVCLTLWFPEHNNVRSEELLARLESFVDVYKLRLSRNRIVRAVQVRVWRVLKGWLIYPVVLRYLARKYALLLTFDTGQAALWPRIESVIVDTDDPMFTSAEIELLGSRQVRSIVVTTDEARQAFRELGVVKPIYVIPQGVDLELLERRKGAVNNHCEGNQDIVAGYLAPGLTLSREGPGRWRGGQDDLDLLFESFAAAHRIQPRLRLWLIGRPSSAVEDYAKDKAWVKLFGYVPVADTWRYISNFDIGLYPRTLSLPIRFSFKIAQYMACGLPVISTLSDALLEEVGCGIVCGSEKELADSLVDLAGSPGKRYQLGQAGARYARKELGWPQLVRKYEKILAV